jgi:hypothetical protein
MLSQDTKWTVKDENKPKFEKAMLSWHYLIKCIGWDDLSDMYVRRVPPFDDVPELSGKNKKAQAKQMILNTLAQDLKQNGLEVLHETNGK